MFSRKLQLVDLINKSSFFLLGPRSIGKSTLIKETMAGALIIDLLDSDQFGALLRRPAILREMIGTYHGPVVIDEIQKLPALLDEVQSIIEKKKNNFLLTGSSARKLKRKATNLLGGRARTAHLFPLISHEIPDFDLKRYLNTGGIPRMYLSEEPDEDLIAYVDNYVRDEILAESVVRNIQPFVSFLDMVAKTNGGEINFENFAGDCGVSPNTIKNYIQILEDTLIGFQLPAFSKSIKRKPITRSKLFLFDIGVVNQLAKRHSLESGSVQFGDAFEHFIVNEVRAYLSYFRRREALCYWRSTSDFEVDLIVGDLMAIEIKSTTLVRDKHLKGLRAFKEEGLVRQYICVSADVVERKMDDGIVILPWKTFLERLWSGILATHVGVD